MTSEKLNLDAIKKALAVNGDAGWSADVVRALVEEVERLSCRVDDLERAWEFVRLKASLHERAAVVAWLRGRQEATEWALTAAAYEHAADAIERGEHRREEER